MVNTKAEQEPGVKPPVADADIHDDPLADCLVQLAKLYDRPVSRTALTAGLPLVDNRLTVDLVKRAAGRAGMAARVLKRPLKSMTPLELPAVLVLKNYRACILLDIKIEEGKLSVLLPETGMGEDVVSFSDIENLYSGYAIFVRPKFRKEARKIDEIEPHAKSWFWGTIFSSWRIYRDVLIASFLINLFGLAGSFFTLNVYDRVIPNQAFETLWVMASGILVVYIFNLIMRALRGYFIDEAGKKANLQISAVLLEKVLGLRMEVRPKSVGSFSKNLQQFESIRDFITSFSITALIDLPFMFIAMIAVWYLGGSIVFIHICAVVALAMYAYLVQAPLRKAVEKSFQASAQKNAILVEGLSGIETIKMLGAENQIQRAWEESVSYIAKWSARSRLFSSSVNHFANFVMNMIVVATVIAGVYAISKGELSMGGLIALVILSRQAVAPMTQVVSLATRYHRAKTALKTLNEIMNLPVERPPGKTFLQRSSFSGAIELKNLTFSYPGQVMEALKDISLSIKPGEKIGIIGPIGSGKTTLGKLLLGLYEPTGGMVSMDGTDIRQIDPSELRRFIGYVPQDVTLFRGTLRENIILGSPNVDDEDILRAADMAGVSEFAGKHAKGFDLEVGEQGRGLSGGQRQSVAMARALLHDPPIMILDEPSSSMDNRTESRLKAQLGKVLPGKTMVLITHRASLLGLVDRVVVIDNGAIVADGPREKVLEALKKGQLNI